MLRLWGLLEPIVCASLLLALTLGVPSLLARLGFERA